MVKMLNKDYSRMWREGKNIEYFELLQRQLKNHFIDSYDATTTIRNKDVPEKAFTKALAAILVCKYNLMCHIEYVLTKQSRVDIFIPSVNQTKELSIQRCCRSDQDIVIPYYSIAIEVKIDNRRSKGSRKGETPAQQLSRYKRCKKVDNAFLVSIDGSIGLDVDELLSEIEKVLYDVGSVKVIKNDRRQ